MNFLDLPREIRDQIYTYALVADEPISVWDQEIYGPSELRKDYRRIQTKEDDEDDENTALFSVAFPLLRICRIIRSEAAEVFYKYNIFYFAGTELWQPLCVFLEMLGEHSRAHLRHLRLCPWHPRRIIAVSGNIYRTNLNWKYRTIRTYDEDLDGLRVPVDNAPLDFIDPALKPLFMLLGKDRPLLTITMQQAAYSFPGITKGVSLTQSWITRSMLLPNTMEFLRAKYAGPYGQVRIFWEITVAFTSTAVDEGEFGRVGWKVLKKAERWDEPALGFLKLPTITLTLERKPLEAGDPSVSVTGKRLD